MPKVVEPKPATAGRPRELAELRTEMVGRPGAAVRTWHDEIVVGVLGRTGGVLFGFVFAQHCDAFRCDMLAEARPQCRSNRKRDQRLHAPDNLL
jgi:hypothetical protein